VAASSLTFLTAATVAVSKSTGGYCCGRTLDVSEHRVVPLPFTTNGAAAAPGAAPLPLRRYRRWLDRHRQQPPPATPPRLFSPPATPAAALASVLQQRTVSRANRGATPRHADGGWERPPTHNRPRGVPQTRPQHPPDLSVSSRTSVVQHHRTDQGCPSGGVKESYPSCFSGNVTPQSTPLTTAHHCAAAQWSSAAAAPCCCCCCSWRQQWPCSCAPHCGIAVAALPTTTAAAQGRRRRVRSSGGRRR